MLYFIVTGLPDSLTADKDLLLALDPTDLAVDLLEKHLLAAETSIVAVGASRGTPRTPFFEGCSPSPLLPSVASAAAVDYLRAEEVEAVVGAVEAVVRAAVEEVVVVGAAGQVAAVVAAVGVVAEAAVVAVVVTVGVEAAAVGVAGVASARGEALEVASGNSSSSSIRSSVSGFLSVGRLGVVVPAHPSIEADALGASESAALGAGESALSGTTSAAALHAFTLDSAQSLHVPPLFCPVQRFRLGHCHVSTSPRSLRTWSLPPLPPSPAPPCLPCVEGRQRAAPHSSSFSPIEAPLQTLHLNVWGPARVRGQGHERYFLLVVDDYSRYTTVFPLRRKGEVLDVLIPWIRAVRLQLRERFETDLLVLRLHSDRGGEFSSDLLWTFCRAEGIRQTFKVSASPQQNGVGEHRIGLVMEVARTSMIHAAAPHFLWPFAVQYAAHQLNLWPRVSLPETSPTLRWTREVGDASVFRVWGCRAFVHDTSADKQSTRAVPCVFLGFVPNAPGWQFYHPTSRLVLPSQDVTFDKSVPFHRLFPYRTASLPRPPHFLAPGPPPVDPLPPQGPAPSSVFQVDPVEPVKVAVNSGTARGGASGGAEPAGAGPGGAELERAEPGGAEPGGAESEGAEAGGAEPVGAEPGGTERERAEPGGVEPGGAEPECAKPGGPSGVLSRPESLSSLQLREWFARRWSLQSGAAGAGGAGATSPGDARTGGTGAAGAGGTTGATGGAGSAGAGAAGCTAGAGAAGESGATSPGGARTESTGAAGAGGTTGAAGGAAGAKGRP
ncbi:unnamed protein product [Closterium sp. NIES-64]|nr:unnamed protein product [Closterium sp. NIES-64]